MTTKRKKYPYLEYVLAGVVLILTTLLVLTYYLDWRQPRLPEPETDNYQTLKEQYLREEESVIVPISNGTTTQQLLPIEPVLFEYIEVIDGCGPHFGGECLNVRSSPSLVAPVVSQLRTGVVLKVGGQVENEGMTWYKVVFDEWLRYPGRVRGDWYVAADYVAVLLDEGNKTVWEDGAATTSKQIIVDRSEQKLYAYEG